MKRSIIERKYESVTGQKIFHDDQKYLERARMKFALLKENFEYRKWFPKFKDEVLKNEGLKAAEIEISILDIFQKFRLWRIDGLPKNELQEFIDFYDPDKEIPAGDPSEYLGSLRYNLLSGLKTIFLSKGIVAEKRTDLMPYETAFKVDLRIRKAQLLREFEYELDEALSKHPAEGGEPDKSREGKEALQLDVWKQRGKKIGFPAIARKMKITQDLAKHHFYRAYELTQGRPYDPERYRIEAWKNPKLKKTCQACPDYPGNGGTCRELCPEVMAWVDQDQESRLGKPQSFEVLSNIKNHSWNQFEDFGEEEETLYSDEDTENFREEVIHPAKFTKKTIVKKKK